VHVSTNGAVTAQVTLERVDVETGEEAEECVHECRGKMFWWGKGNAGMQWKERVRRARERKA